MSIKPHNMLNCPLCHREFKNINQWHSCLEVDVSDHLAGRSDEVCKIIERLLEVLHKFGKATVNASHGSIQVRSGINFLSIKTKKEHVDLEFLLSERWNEPPVHKVVKLSKNRYAHHLKLGSIDELNNNLITILEQSFEFGNQTG